MSRQQLIRCARDLVTPRGEANAVHTHVLRGLSRARVHGWAVCLFVVGGSEQRRMVEFLREQGGVLS